eukprot:GHVS01065420.1.p1 GENE.GHVS01065420.1~~GHVS01065420.1.p1  ORF type:complete len:317 (+),score=50.08 GHVS01065420.1:89-1039(+)
MVVDPNKWLQARNATIRVGPEFQAVLPQYHRHPPVHRPTAEDGSASAWGTDQSVPSASPAVAATQATKESSSEQAGSTSTNATEVNLGGDGGNDRPRGEMRGGRSLGTVLCAEVPMEWLEPAGWKDSSEHQRNLTKQYEELCKERSLDTGTILQASDFMTEGGENDEEDEDDDDEPNEEGEEAVFEEPGESACPLDNDGIIAEPLAQDSSLGPDGLGSRQDPISSLSQRLEDHQHEVSNDLHSAVLPLKRQKLNSGEPITDEVLSDSVESKDEKFTKEVDRQEVEGSRGCTLNGVAAETLEVHRKLSSPNGHAADD